MPFVRHGEDITYWEPKSSDVFGGDTFWTPKTVKGRWEDVAELFRDKTGQEVVSRSLVYLDIDINVNGYLYRGISTVADPRTLPEALEIRQFSSIPDLRYLRKLRVAYL